MEEIILKRKSIWKHWLEIIFIFYQFLYWWYWKYTEMIIDIKVSVGLGSVSYTNITDFESEKEFLTSIKKKKYLLLDYLKWWTFRNIGFNSLDMVNRNGALGVLIGNPKHHEKVMDISEIISSYGFSFLNLRNISLKVFEYNK